MGMYDHIKFEMICPMCKGEVIIKGFQSKDGHCMLSDLEYWEVDNFYSNCPKCKSWIEFNRIKPPREKIPITDYEMIIKNPTKGFNISFNERDNITLLKQTKTNDI